MPHVQALEDEWLLQAPENEVRRSAQAWCISLRTDKREQMVNKQQQVQLEQAIYKILDIKMAVVKSTYAGTFKMLRIDLRNTGKRKRWFIHSVVKSDDPCTDDWTECKLPPDFNNEFETTLFTEMFSVTRSSGQALEYTKEIQKFLEKKYEEQTGRNISEAYGSGKYRPLLNT